MRPLLLLALIAGLFFACGTATQESAETETPEAEEAGESRYSYSDSFEAGDPSYQEIVRNWNKAIVAGNLDEAFSYAADSLNIILSDGTNWHAGRDSIKAVATEILSGISNMNVEFMAGLSITSLPQGHNWVLSYTNESMTNAEGDQNMIVHELYRFVDGKIRSIFQYLQVPTEADAAGKPTDGEYTYSGSFEILDNSNVEIVEGWIDAIVAQDWETGKSYLADSVTIFFSDGNYMNTVADTLIALGQQYFEGASLEVEYVGALSTRSTVQETDWVLVWTSETYTKGDETSITLYHEAYMIVDNKIRLVRQFSRPAPEDYEEAEAEGEE